MAGFGLRPCECCDLVDVQPVRAARAICSVCRAVCPPRHEPAYCRVQKLLKDETMLAAELMDALAREAE